MGAEPGSREGVNPRQGHDAATCSYGEIPDAAGWLSTD